MPQQSTFGTYVNNLVKALTGQAVDSDQFARLSAEVQAQRLQLEALLARQPEREAFTLRMIMNLRGALEDIVGGNARDVRIEDNLLRFALAPVHVTINAFEQWFVVAPAVPTPREMEPLKLTFSTEGKISDRDKLLLRGYVADLADPARETEFWNGAQVA